MKAFVLIILSTVVLSGCTGLEPAAIGAGVNAVQTGVSYVSGRNAYSYQPALYEDVYLAALRAGDRLALELYTDRVVSLTGHEIKYNFGERGTNRIVVTITSSTDAVTKVVVNTKKNSTRGMSTLYLQMLTDELVNMGAYDPGLAAPTIHQPN
jgi:hypothetical protein